MTGLVVVIIGLYLVPAAMGNVGGGANAANFGAAYNVGLAMLVLGVAVALNLFTKGVTRLLSTLAGIALAALGVALGLATVFIPNDD